MWARAPDHLSVRDRMWARAPLGNPSALAPPGAPSARGCLWAQDCSWAQGCLWARDYSWVRGHRRNHRPDRLPARSSAGFHLVPQRHHGHRFLRNRAAHHPAREFPVQTVRARGSDGVRGRPRCLRGRQPSRCCPPRSPPSRRLRPWASQWEEERCPVHVQFRDRQAPDQVPRFPGHDSGRSPRRPVSHPRFQDRGSDRSPSLDHRRGPCRGPCRDPDYWHPAPWSRRSSRSPVSAKPPAAACSHSRGPDRPAPKNERNQPA